MIYEQVEKGKICLFVLGIKEIKVSFNARILSLCLETQDMETY